MNLNHCLRSAVLRVSLIAPALHPDFRSAARRFRSLAERCSAASLRYGAANASAPFLLRVVLHQQPIATGSTKNRT